MSYLETIQAHNIRLENAVDKANALQDVGGGSGGGSIETCTVTVRLKEEGRITSICYTQYQSSGISNVKDTNTYKGETYITLENVVCKSMILFTYGYNMWGDYIYDATPGMIPLEQSTGNFSLVSIDATQGQNIEITIDNDY